MQILFKTFVNFYDVPGGRVLEAVTNRDIKNHSYISNMALC